MNKVAVIFIFAFYLMFFNLSAAIDLPAEGLN
jgi:hypothetical protein